LHFVAFAIYLLQCCASEGRTGPSPRLSRISRSSDRRDSHRFLLNIPRDSVCMMLGRSAPRIVCPKIENFSAGV
jgi:hypothetical protein